MEEEETEDLNVLDATALLALICDGLLGASLAGACVVVELPAGRVEEEEERRREGTTVGRLGIEGVGRSAWPRKGRLVAMIVAGDTRRGEAVEGWGGGVV